MINPRLFFSADHHFSHKNIIIYENRPFKTIEEMNQAIISNHNKIVHDEDVCLIAGDLYFRGGKEAGKVHYYEFLKRMNGRITVIKGNHDLHSNKIIDPIYKASLTLSGLKILCLHDPFYADTAHNLVVHGHVHSLFKIAELNEKGKKSLLINCGVDVWDFKPVEWRDLFAIYSQWKAGKLTNIYQYDKEAVKKQRELRRKQK